MTLLKKIFRRFKTFFVRISDRLRVRSLVIGAHLSGSQVRKRVLQNSVTVARKRDAFELDYVMRWVEQNVGRICDRSEEVRRSIVVPKNWTPNVYIFWEQGFDNAPELIKWLKDRIAKHHQPDQLCELSKDNMSGFVPVPDKLYTNLRLPNHRANLLRMELLARRGGVWVDSTCLININLIDFLGDFFNEGRDYFAFYDEQQARIRNWFMASKPNGHIATTMLSAWRLFVEENTHFCNYESYHFYRWLFESLYYIDDTFRNIWVNQSSTSDILPSYCFVRTMRRTSGNIMESSKCLDHARIHKLTHKRPEQINVLSLEQALISAGLT